MERVKATDYGGVIDTWKKKHRLLFTGATRHPFILTIRDGAVDISSFKRWLGQDYKFVRAFVPFVANVLIKAWKESGDNGADVDLILSAMASLNDEIAWFNKEASNWDVELTKIVPLKTNHKYCSFLESLMAPGVEYTVAITALWAIEFVYRESFAVCLEVGAKTSPELKETCQRWGNDKFGEYCNSLEETANRHLQNASDDVVSKAETTLLRVLEHEVDFWNMSRGET